MCMQVLKGSHTLSLLPKRNEGKGVKENSNRTGAADENVLGTHIDLCIDESEVVAIPLNAGEQRKHFSAIPDLLRTGWVSCC